MENQNQNNLVSSQNPNSPIVRADIGVLFAGDSYGLFVFQKTDKLVKAIYLLTGLMSDKEPMRERTRALANKMLENALNMSERIWGEETYQKNLLSAISEVSVLFDIAENTKMMSKMNHQIITSELKKLADFLITSSANYSSAKIAFEPNLFDGNYNYVPDQTFQAIPSIQNPNIVKNDSIKDMNYFHKGQNELLVESVRNRSNEKVSFTKTDVPVKIVKDKNNRKDIILSMLKSGVKLTIKDFAKNIKDCSEKTIQRELSTLVSKGVLKKEGERRWSKYFIVK
ncbi:MAG: hypothetical protein ABIF22_02290 [bacterium]